MDRFGNTKRAFLMPAAHRAICSPVFTCRDMRTWQVWMSRRNCGPQHAASWQQKRGSWMRVFHRVLASGDVLSVRVPNMSASIASYNATIDFTHITPSHNIRCYKCWKLSDSMQHESHSPVTCRDCSGRSASHCVPCFARPTVCIDT